MSWITLTSADLAARLSESERQAMDEQDLVEGQTAPVTAILSAVTSKIRRSVAKGGCALGAGATIPDELLDAAISIARYRLCCRFPSTLLNEDRRKEYADALEELADVAEDAAGIAAPTTEDTSTLNESATPSYTETDPPQGPRNFDRTDQEGI
jgi:phage gp36-like protein